MLMTGELRGRALMWFAIAFELQDLVLCLCQNTLSCSVERVVLLLDLVPTPVLYLLQ